MESGIRALTVALALRLPGDYLPLEGPGVTDQQESVAGLSGHSLLTAFPYKCGSLGRRPMERRASASLWQTCSVTVLQRRVAMKVAFPGGLTVPEGQVPFSIYRPESASALFLPQRLFDAADRMSNLKMLNHIVED